MSVSDNLLTLFQFVESNSDVEGVNSIAGTSRQQQGNRNPRDECKLEHNSHSNRERVTILANWCLMLKQTWVKKKSSLGVAVVEVNSLSSQVNFFFGGGIE